MCTPRTVLLHRTLRGITIRYLRGTVVLTTKKLTDRPGDLERGLTDLSRHRHRCRLSLLLSRWPCCYRVVSLSPRNVSGSTTLLNLVSTVVLSICYIDGRIIN